MVSIRARDIRNEWSRLDMGPEGPDRYLNTRNVLRGWKHGAYLDIENYIKSRDRDGLERYVGEQFKKALLPHKTPSGETNELTVDQKSRIEWIVSHYETIRNTSKAEEDQFYKLPSQAEEVGTFQSLEQDRRHRQPYSGHPSSPSSRDGQPSPPSRTLARVPQYKQSSRPAPYPNHRTEDYHPPPSTASSRHVTPPSVGFNHSYVRDTSSNIPYYPPPSSNKPDLPFRLQLPPLSSITQFLDPSYQSQFPPRYPSTKFATSNPAQYPNAGPSRSSEYPPLPPAPGYYPTQATLSYLQPQATSSYLQPQPTSSYLQQQNASIYLQPHASRSSDGANPPPPERARAPLHSP
ncbi:MAG: hypothetical protein LQ350_008181 [Teloschistes chrysophthalmus]|nr:MAG: hypothetical protein LQ350_008181 [Niorma chrysophthalma]